MLLAVILKQEDANLDLLIILINSLNISIYYFNKLDISNIVNHMYEKQVFLSVMDLQMCSILTGSIRLALLSESVRED